jgi:hypothetical protein
MLALMAAVVIAFAVHGQTAFAAGSAVNHKVAAKGVAPRGVPCAETLTAVPQRTSIIPFGKGSGPGGPAGMVALMILMFGIAFMLHQRFRRQTVASTPNPLEMKDDARFGIETLMNAESRRTTKRRGLAARLTPVMALLTHRRLSGLPALA